MSLDQKSLGILVCPVCKRELIFDKLAKELICCGDRLAFPIIEDIPVMLVEQARSLSEEEREKYR